MSWWAWMLLVVGLGPVAVLLLWTVGRQALWFWLFCIACIADIALRDVGAVEAVQELGKRWRL